MKTDELEAFEKELADIRRQRMILDQHERAILVQHRRHALMRIERLMEASGLSPEDLELMIRRSTDVGRKRAVEQNGLKEVKRVAPKFRHPDDPNLTWSGRGKTPLWVKALMAAGQLDSARVDPKFDDDGDESSEVA
jgi:DNA-binding protein H-NS